MNSEKRLIVAIALSVLVILGYQSYMKKYQKPKINPTQGQEQIYENAQENLLVPDQVRMKKAIRENPVKSIQDKTTVIEDDIFRVVLTDNGAAIKELYLLKYKEQDGSPTALLQVSKGLPLALGTQDLVSEEEGLWDLVREERGVITYRKETAQKIVEKKFTFYNSNYTIGLELKIQNKAGHPQDIRYKIINGPALISNGYVDKRYVGLDVQIGDKVQKRKPGSKSIKGGEVFYGSPEWVSSRGRYFSFVLKPEQKEEAAFIQSEKKDSAWSGIVLGPMRIESNETIIRNYTLYAGPNHPDKLAVLGATSGNIISYGVFGGIAKLLFKGLALFYKIFGNYGLAIIMLSIAISAVMFPLTRKSMRSMKEMQKVQPEVERIKKENSGNPQKMNKAIMELYKEHKVNPMGGCFPMLLQLPIFLSLYQVLLKSVELKGASFLWIKDLSAPDALFTLQQKFPIIQDKINLLPLLMALAMFVQQKVSHPGGEVSEQQRMMAVIMPIMLGFIFYSLPSGLVLYWLTNTLLTLLVQEVILKTRQKA